MRKIILILGFLLGFGFLAVYSVSVYIHRNDGRFNVGSGLHAGAAIDTRTGQMCLTIRPKEPSQVMPFCGDLR